MRPTGRKRRGASIIEVVLALMILSVGLPPLMVCFVEASLQSVRPAQATIAGFLAQERMEEIIARRYRGTDGYAAVTASEFPSEAAVAGFPGFSRAVSIRYATASLGSAPSDEGYKVVRVTVVWRGGAESIEIEHAFADF